MNAVASSPSIACGETRHSVRTASFGSGRFAFSPCFTFMSLALPSLSTTSTRGSLPSARPIATLPS
jgi:hypothetical protein